MIFLILPLPSGVRRQYYRAGDLFGLAAGVAVGAHCVRVVRHLHTKPNIHQR
jgi:hypothetical protein